MTCATYLGARLVHGDHAGLVSFGQVEQISQILPHQIEIMTKDDKIRAGVVLPHLFYSMIEAIADACLAHRWRRLHSCCGMVW